MSSLHIRNVDEDVKLCLEFVATSERRSVSSLVRDILSVFVRDHMDSMYAWNREEYLREMRQRGLDYDQDKAEN